MRTVQTIPGRLRRQNDVRKAPGTALVGSPGLRKPVVPRESEHDRAQDQSRFRGARVDREVRPRGRAPGAQPAAVPLRPDQRAEVPQAARRDRRHRPGDGQPHRSARGVGHRQALRGRPRLAEPPLQRRHRRLQPAPRGRRRYESRFGVSLDPDHEVVATIGSKEGFSHMCLALLGPGDTALVPAPSFPIHIHADRAGLRQRDLAGRPRLARPSWPTSPGPARACTRGPRSWS